MANEARSSALEKAQRGRLLTQFLEGGAPALEAPATALEAHATALEAHAGARSATRGRAKARPAGAVRTAAVTRGTAAGARAKAAAPPRPLDGGERLRVLDVLIEALGGVYCHLLQKRSAYAIDPVQALRLLQGRAAAMSEAEFHLMVSSIVTGLRDAHTRYVQTRYAGPDASRGSVAALPFLVEQHGPYDEPAFIVSKVVDRDSIDDDRFVAGVALESWSGVPFARAVDIYAERETGGRPDARRARALESLTFRALEYGPPPDEMWVIVGYRPVGSTKSREVRIPWRVVSPERGPDAARPGARASRFLATDRSAELVRRAKKLLFSGRLWAAEAGPREVARRGDWIPTTMQDALAAREVETSQGTLGYLRMWTFDVEDDDAFVAEVARLVSLLPQKGLVLDLRGNPGGLIWAAERSLQLFTPNRIVPTRFSLLASDTTRAMAASAFNRLELEAWLSSLDAAITTGDAYSQPLPLTDPDWCNDFTGRRYGGRVACIVDANTYSAGDLFAAGFLDNGIGPLVCVGEASGGGGANVWTDHDLQQALAETSCPLPPLPEGIGFSIAIRRAVRSGDADGVPIEDLGVAGIPYAMTKDDLLCDNRDLVEFCARRLAGE